MRNQSNIVLISKLIEYNWRTFIEPISGSGAELGGERKGPIIRGQRPWSKFTSRAHDLPQLKVESAAKQIQLPAAFHGPKSNNRRPFKSEMTLEKWKSTDFRRRWSTSNSGFTYHNESCCSDTPLNDVFIVWRFWLVTLFNTYKRLTKKEQSQAKLHKTTHRDMNTKCW